MCSGKDISEYVLSSRFPISGNIFANGALILELPKTVKGYFRYFKEFRGAGIKMWDAGRNFHRSSLQTPQNF